MIEKYNTAKINRRILSAISDLSLLHEKVEELADKPTVELAEEIDGIYKQFWNSSEALKNAITTLAKEIAGVDVDEDGEKEIDVIPDENGLRLN